LHGNAPGYVTPASPKGEPLMPKKKLTDLFVERVRGPAKGRIEYFDASFPGLALRVTDNDAKSWSLFYRLNGRQSRFTIGTCPPIKPADARREAQAALDQVRAGIDPAAEKRKRQYLRPPEADTFGAVAEDWLERYVRPNNPKSYAEIKRIIEREAMPKWRKRPIGSIDRRDVIDLVDEIIARGAKVMANRTLAWLRALFNWAVEKERLAVSPIGKMKKPTKEKERDRVLSDDELQWLWPAAEKIGWPFGPLTKLLLLTAQRRDEVAGMMRSRVELGNRTWTIPSPDAKNELAHDVQLSDAAISILKSLPVVADEGELIFTVTGETPVSGFSRAKRRLDQLMIAAKREALGKQKNDEIPNWTFHDLRRTATTRMAKLGFAPHVVDKILNHSSGTIRGVAKIYNRFEYFDERRAALEAWGRYVENLVTPAPANVVRLRG
jgi:integrase